MRNTLSSGSMRPDIEPMHRRGQGLVDVLDRVLDKGLIVAGDIRIALAEVELLTIRIRLLVCSIDKAEQIGLDWWRHDPYLNPKAAPRELPPQSASAQVPDRPERDRRATKITGRKATSQKATSRKATSKRKTTKTTKTTKATKVRKAKGGSGAR